jgi:exopolyphosphatase/guanosine-5'-triphosphate,3'-diphosphate pyrophosphatase
MLFIEPGWLERNPLTDTALSGEIEQWDALGFKLHVKYDKERLDRSEKAARGTDA